MMGISTAYTTTVKTPGMPVRVLVTMAWPSTAISF